MARSEFFYRRGKTARSSVRLTRSQWNVLHVIVRAKGKPVPISRLLVDALGYPEGCGVKSRTVERHVSTIRSLIGPALIVTIPVAGYAWRGPSSHRPRLTSSSS